MPYDIEGTRARLQAGNGGYAIVHSSPGLEIGVYVLVAPEPDRQQPHEIDEVYVVLEGSGALEIEGETHELGHGQALFVPSRRRASLRRLRATERPGDLRGQ